MTKVPHRYDKNVSRPGVGHCIIVTITTCTHQLVLSILGSPCVFSLSLSPCKTITTGTNKDWHLSTPMSVMHRVANTKGGNNHCFLHLVNILRVLWKIVYGALAKCAWEQTNDVRSDDLITLSLI